jgi:predicted acyl esterase
MGRRWVLGAAAVLALALPAVAAAEPRPFGHACEAQNGVRFCPTPNLAERVNSWDGVPLDVDVTLPATGDGPFPTIVMLHGWGGNKRNFETIDAEGRTQPGQELTRATLHHYNNVHFAQRGYAVINYTARGFGDSCGSRGSRDGEPECQDGWIHLADHRFEGRDTQHLLGLLVDEGLVHPSRIGVTGISYGGGQSMQLAMLRNRVREAPTDQFRPWTSPRGTPMSIAAAWPKWLWSDLVYSLLPNGRFLDFENPAPDYQRVPIGVPIQTFITGLYALGATSGYYAPPGADPDADLTTWYTRVSAGEPTTPDARAIADEIADHHQGFNVPDGDPPPLLLNSGWTDDLFPVHESLRMYNALRARDRDFPVSLQFGDFGHQRGSNKLNSDRYLNEEGSAFLDRWVKGDAAAPAPNPGSVTAFTQTCPREAPAEGPFRATSWRSLHPGSVTFAEAEPRTIRGDAAEPQQSRAIDPVAGGGNACVATGSDDVAGTAVYRLPASNGWTLLGRPTVRARIATTGPFGQLDSRLWDVAPDGTQTLVTRGAYRLEDNQSGEVVFQLWGNGWRFERGHVPKLELLGRDAPYLRPSNGEFGLEVRDVRLELPTLEAAGAGGGQVGEPGTVARPGRARPRGLRVRVTRRITRRARRFTTTGRLLLPAFVTASEGCRGRVSVQVKSGRRTVSTRRASLGPRCTFRSRVTFRDPRRLRGARTLRFTVRFHGNGALLRRAARSVRVRAR